jgi:tRNA(His) guanylyltransferase
MQIIIFIGIQEKVLATRRRIKVDMELPLKDDYSLFLRDLIMREHPETTLIKE